MEIYDVFGQWNNIYYYDVFAEANSDRLDGFIAYLVNYMKSHNGKVY
jgi:hypothetical protein